MKIRMSQISGIALYIIIGIGLAFVDLRAVLMFFTVLPFHFLLLRSCIRRKQYVFIVLFLLLFTSIGINSVTFFIYEEDYKNVGFKAIGDFDFSIIKYFESYLYIFLFSIVLYLIMCLLGSSRSGSTYSVLVGFFSQEKDARIHKLNNANIYIFLICFFSIIMTTVMYQNQIGIRGMTQTALPFHLTGIIYYFREFIITGILFYLYLKSPNRTKAAMWIMFYLFFASFTSVSRMLVGFLAMPMILESMVSKNKKRAIVIGLYYFVMFTWMTNARNYVYSYTTVIYSLPELIRLSISESIQNPFGRIPYLINEISGRLYGGQCIVLASQYRMVSFSQMLSYYVGTDIASIIPNMMTVMFGLKPVAGMSFGVSVGYNGQMILFCNGNYLLAALQGAIVALIFTVLQFFLSKITDSGCGEMKKMISIAIATLSVFVFWLGETLLLVYFFIAIIFVMSLLNTKICNGMSISDYQKSN